MLFTKESDYAIRIIRALAAGDIISVPEICKMEHLTSAITYKLTRKLEKSGLIKSTRGSRGGYSLNCRLNDLTLYDICAAIESDILLTECMKKDYHCPLNRAGKPCSVHSEFCRVQSVLLIELKRHSLADLISK